MKNKTIFTLLSVILISLPPVSQAGTGDCENAITGKELILERITKDRASFIKRLSGSGSLSTFYRGTSHSIKDGLCVYSSVSEPK